MAETRVRWAARATMTTTDNKNIAMQLCIHEKRDGVWFVVDS
jgi:hypothetical protein